MLYTVIGGLMPIFGVVMDPHFFDLDLSMFVDCSWRLMPIMLDLGGQ